MIFVWNYLLFSSFIKIITGFNLEPSLPLIKYGHRDSYFGYSVAEHIVINDNNRQPILLVGAPRAHGDEPGVDHSGAVYQCPLNTQTRDCTPLDTLPFRSREQNFVDKNDQWLGVVVKSEGPGGFVMTCAHRYVHVKTNARWGFGICYSYDTNLQFHRTWEPCIGKPVNKAHEQYGYCQAGTSGDISEEHDIIIGVPGPYTWRGTLFTNAIRWQLRDEKAWHYGPVLENQSPVDKYSYLGMSVTSGKYFSNKISFVGGAPRSNGTGQVVFFSKQKDNLFNVDLILSGEQFASSFGYSMISMDINNDRKLDLIVGAPFFYNGTRGIGGAVYIFINSREKFSLEDCIKLFGKQESRFGFSLANLGDINLDGYNDLAVGAPYDEGGGAVYIYLGTSSGIKTIPVQVIKGTDLPQEFSTFGYSLSGGLDMDQNKYPDLLVGAYESDAVALLRARPILDIVTSVKGNLNNIDPNSQGCLEDRSSKLSCFKIEACFKFNSTLEPNYLRLNYTIVAETFAERKNVISRVKFNSSEENDNPHIVNRILTFRDWSSLRREHCSTEIVYITDKSDIQRPIQFKLTYSLDQQIEPMPYEGSLLPDINRYPILNQEEAHKIFEARFLKECRSNDYCNSDLNIKASLNLPTRRNRPVLYLGNEDVELTIEVSNENEPAYDANVYIFHEALSYIGKTQIYGEQVECRLVNITLIICNLGNPFKKGKNEFILRFNPKEIPEEKSFVDIKIEVNTTSSDISPEKNKHNLRFDVIRNAELAIQGSSDPEQVWYGGKVVGESAIRKADEIGNKVEHSYTISSGGPYHPKELRIEFEWPYAINDEGEPGKWLLYLMNTIVIQGKGQCRIKPEWMNGLGIENSEDSMISSPYIRTRRKRQTIVKAQKVTESGKVLNIVTMDCRSGNAACYKFDCILTDLQPGHPSVIKIEARLWNATFVEDYAHNIHQIRLISKARLILDPSIMQRNTADDISFVTTKAYPDLPLLPTQKVPLWVIILSVLLGILALLLIVIVLWKCGFFHRNKYMAANTEDKEFNNY